MRISEVISALQRIKDKEGDLETCYASDDEGNDFKENCFSPSFGYSCDFESFIPHNDIEDQGWSDEEIEKYIANNKKVCCIN